jgi:hypothetical protein
MPAIGTLRGSGAVNTLKLASLEKTPGPWDSVGRGDEALSRHCHRVKVKPVRADCAPAVNSLVPARGSIDGAAIPRLAFTRPRKRIA